MDSRKEPLFKQTEIGKIPENWEVEELGKLGEVATGKGTKKLESGKYPIIGANGILGFTNEYLEDEELIYTGRVGTIGRVNYQKKGKVWLSDNVLYFKTEKAELLRFIYYFLMRIDFSYLNVGSTQPLVKQSDFQKLLIATPKKGEELELIVKILSGLDSKIELNQRMNKTLQAIGQAIFKRWFVDFEFPNDEGKPYKSSGGEMVESEKGRVPNGWKVAEVNSFGKVVCGKTPPKSKKEFFGGDMPFIKIPDMHNQLFIINTEDTLTDKGRRYQANKSIPSNSICVSCIATVGLVSITAGESQTNQQINCIVPHEEFSMPYLFYTMKSLKRELKDLGSGGSATLNVNTSTFSSIRLIAPKADVMKEFYRIAAPLFAKIRANLFENRTLSQIRDSLLPKLMSGKIRVPVLKESMEVS
jgi:type I restriction enzyme S subunit